MMFSRVLFSLSNSFGFCLDSSISLPPLFSFSFYSRCSISFPMLSTSFSLSSFIRATNFLPLTFIPYFFLFTLDVTKVVFPPFSVKVIDIQVSSGFESSTAATTRSKQTVKKTVTQSQAIMLLPDSSALLAVLSCVLFSRRNMVIEMKSH